LRVNSDVMEPEKTQLDVNATERDRDPMFTFDRIK
jgi:hypothetical protein